MLSPSVNDCHINMGRYINSERRILMYTGKGVMSKIRVGDVVARISYNCDIYFKVAVIYAGDDGRDYARLKGLELRLEADAPLDDLMVVDAEAVKACLQKCEIGKVEKMINVFRRRSEDSRRYSGRALGERVEGGQ